jgi:hypothetical protein
MIVGFSAESKLILVRIRGFFSRVVFAAPDLNFRGELKL